jgi:purine-binding chemotaxis protein CheW
MIYPTHHAAARDAAPASEHGYVSFRVGGQWFGIPVAHVQEVLRGGHVSPVPLAPAQVAGFLNLRGQIVTAIDLRARLGLAAAEGAIECMDVVVDDRGELFSFRVDEVGDVVEGFEVDAVPPGLDAEWRSCCDGVLRMPVGLLAVVNVAALLRTAATV